MGVARERSGQQCQALGSTPSAASSPFASVTPSIGLLYNSPPFQFSSASSNPSFSSSSFSSQISLFGSSSPSSSSSPFGGVGSSTSSGQIKFGFGSTSAASLAPSSTLFGPSSISSTGSSLFGAASLSSTGSTLFGASSVSSGPTPAFSSSTLFGPPSSSGAISSTTTPTASTLFGASPASVPTAAATSSALFGASSASATPSTVAPASTTTSSTTSSSFPDFEVTSAGASSGTTSSFPSFSLSTKSSAPASSSQAQTTTASPLYGVPTSTAAAVTTSSSSTATVQTSSSLVVGSSSGTTSTFTTAVAPSLKIPSEITGKTVEEIIKESNTELQERTGKFRKQATAIAEWDKKILQNCDVLLRLKIEVAKVVETQAQLERQLELIETHQQEVNKGLLSIKEEAEHIYKDEHGLLLDDEATSTRDAMYEQAEYIEREMEQMAEQIKSIIQTLNTNQGELDVMDGMTPLDVIVQILNNQLSSLMWQRRTIERTGGSGNVLSASPIVEGPENLLIGLKRSSKNRKAESSSREDQPATHPSRVFDTLVAQSPSAVEAILLPSSNTQEEREPVCDTADNGGLPIHCPTTAEWMRVAHSVIQHLSMAHFIELGHHVIDDFARRLEWTTELGRKAMEAEREKTTRLGELLRVAEAKREAAEGATSKAREEATYWAEKFTAALVRLKLVEEELAATKDRIGAREKLLRDITENYRKQVQNAYDMGYQSCLDKHKIEEIDDSNSDDGAYPETSD